MKNRTIKDTPENRRSLDWLCIEYKVRVDYKHYGKLFVRVSANDYSRIIKAGLVN